MKEYYIDEAYEEVIDKFDKELKKLINSSVTIKINVFSKNINIKYRSGRESGIYPTVHNINLEKMKNVEIFRAELINILVDEYGTQIREKLNF